VGCSHVLTACMQATSLKGAQGVLWQVAMSPRARCFFFPTPVHTASASGGDRAVLDQQRRDLLIPSSTGQKGV